MYPLYTEILMEQQLEFMMILNWHLFQFNEINNSGVVVNTKMDEPQNKMTVPKKIDLLCYETLNSFD